MEITKKAFVAVWAAIAISIYGSFGITPSTICAAAETASEEAQQMPTEEQPQETQSAEPSSASVGTGEASSESSESAPQTHYSRGGATVSESVHPVSLLSLAGNLIGYALLIIAAGSLLTCGSAVLCAVIYHVGNVLRGGQRPTVG
jgi:hypothetical protein